jgi:hypothetical protein
MMKTADDLLALAEDHLVPESGIHPTQQCLEAGEDLRAALLGLCESETPRPRVWSIAPVRRRTP